MPARLRSLAALPAWRPALLVRALGGAVLALSAACAPDTPTAPHVAAPITASALIAPVSGYVQVSAGYNYTCAVTAASTVTCWGDNSFGRATPPAGLTGVTQVSAGNYHACALTTAGTVTCWGDDTYGQSTPTAGVAGVTQVSAGGYHTCALLAAGTVTCWGLNDNGQTTVQRMPVLTQVSAGRSHNCALTSSGAVWCWGDHTYYKATPPAGIVATQVSAGTFHTCAVTPAGTVTCWGDVNASTPPADLAGVTQVSAGYGHTCALTTGGTVTCWGWWNEYGQLNVPAGLSGVTQVSVGYSHSCALLAAGTITCWGENDHTEATPPTMEVAPVVTQVTVPVDPVAVNTPTALTASFTDGNPGDTHTGTFAWSAGSITGSAAGTVTEANGAGTLTLSQSFSAAGVYPITATVSDGNLTGTLSSAGQSPVSYLVVYDPSTGFVTGGGWITSPTTACPVFCGGAAGKATFGFVSKYQKGATVPSGTTQFDFTAGQLSFTSTSYQWLVIAGARAQYKGTGTINGSGNYGFLLTAIDGDVRGGGGVDKFRIKIWDQASGAVIYDNQMGATDDAALTAAIGGGGIVIHS